MPGYLSKVTPERSGDIKPSNPEQLPNRRTVQLRQLHAGDSGLQKSHSSWRQVSTSQALPQMKRQLRVSSVILPTLHRPIIRTTNNSDGASLSALASPTFFFKSFANDVELSQIILKTAGKISW